MKPSDTGLWLSGYREPVKPGSLTEFHGWALGYMQTFETEIF